jgi:chromosome segregation ATPase
MRQRLLWAAVGLAVGLGGGVGLGWVVWGRSAAAMSERMATLESAATAVQGERERLHKELTDIVRERRQMAETAEHLRAQVEEELHRLEGLASELEPPAGSEPETPDDAQ